MDFDFDALNYGYIYFNLFNSVLWTKVIHYIRKYLNGGLFGDA